jgi:(p)ppGpp synthase/HD superfamily hydrolase
MSDSVLRQFAAEPGSDFQIALAWATELFEHQHRKGKPTVMYLSHLLAVAQLVRHDGGSEAEVVAALLHDVMEDQQVSTDCIAAKLPKHGKEVAEIVFGCSDGVDREGNALGERDHETWTARKQSYLAHLATDATEGMLRVSVADKLDNARDTIDDLREEGPAALIHYNAPPESQLWWWKSLAAVFEERLPESRLTKRFLVAVRELVDLVDLPAATDEWVQYQKANWK